MENKLTIEAVMDEYDEKFQQIARECDLRTSKDVKQFFKEKLEEILKQEKERHLTKLSRALNLHSNPTLEGGLDYEKGFKEVEKYETELAQSLLSIGESK